MRSTIDLIQELDTEAEKFWVCVIAVGFEQSTTIIAHSQENRLELLDEAVAQGGEPVGMLAVLKEPGTEPGTGTLTFCTKVFDEHAQEQQASEYLSKLLYRLAESLGEQSFNQREWKN
jgi:hypothetical protein